MATDAGQTRKRINIKLPHMIVERLDRLASRVHSSRAGLIRRLISERLAEKEREEVEQAMKEGYLANYDFIKESSKEWGFTSGDGV